MPVCSLKRRLRVRTLTAPRRAIASKDSASSSRCSSIHSSQAPQGHLVVGGRRVLDELRLSAVALERHHRQARRRRREPELEGARRALSETGLFRDIARGELADGVVAFPPRFELWSDGASKRRWVWLPPGTTIDARDMDAWRFPTGTKLWKEFARDGVRVETRLLEKVGPAPEAWLAMAYVRRPDGSDAIATPEGAVDALGTPHDVPARRQCMGCHGGTPSRVLGFSAIQLAHEERREGEWSLDELVRAGKLRGAKPVAEVPGDARTQRVLGYLHANCGHCHNQHRPAEPEGGRCYNPRRAFDLSLRTRELAALERTAVFRTALGRVIVPGDPESSALYKRARGDLELFQARMPPLGTEARDPALLPLPEAWIRELEPERRRCPCIKACWCSSCSP